MSRKQAVMAGLVGALLALAVACAAEEPAPVPTLAPGATPTPAPASRPAALMAVEDIALVTERMIVRTVTMSLVVQDPVETADAVARMVQEMEGFVVSSSRQGEEGDTVVTISLRVPSERTDEAIQRLRGLAERVASEEVRAQDVTEEYVDLQARLRNLEATEGQLLTLMQRAETVDETLNVQRELSNVSGEIERLRGRLQYLERTSAMSLVNLTLVPAVSGGPLVKPGWSPLETAKDGVRGLAVAGQGLADLGIYLVILSPLWAPVAIVIWYLVRRERRRTAKRGTPTDSSS